MHSHVQSIDADKMVTNKTFTRYILELEMLLHLFKEFYQMAFSSILAQKHHFAFSHALIECAESVAAAAAAALSLR